jgi:hypothetical protein
MSDNEYIVPDKDLRNDDIIDRFIQGQMDENEEKAFLEELNQNEELRERAILHARLVKGMAQVDDEIIEAYSEAEDSSKNNKATVVSIDKKHSARWLAIAATIVFVVFVGFKSYDYYDTTSLGREYANTFPTSTVIRGEANTDVDTELTMLFNNVAEGKDLDNTTSRLATLWELSKQDTYNDYTDYAPYIGWNLAVGYLRNYEKDMALNVLTEMETIYDNETIIGKKVRELTKVIE